MAYFILIITIITRVVYVHGHSFWTKDLGFLKL